MKNLLLSERWRPKTLDDVILLPRIKKTFENNSENNFIFHGHFGTGKTTLARILIGKYTKDKPHLEINSSFHTSIDTLRTKIDEFCSKVYMGFDLDKDISADETKWVFLDEFDRTSIQYQDALKAYIEEFSKKNVRFIFTTNHINKISPGIRSRLIEVNFDIQSVEEERYLKQELYKKIKNVICPKEQFDIPKEDLVKIINKKFPDFRSILIELDNFRLSGTTSINKSLDNKIKIETYNLVMDKSKSTEDVYNFILSNFGQDNIDQLLDLFGKPFIEYSLSENRSNIDKLFQVSHVVCTYKPLLETSLDPLIVGMSSIGKIRELF